MSADPTRKVFPGCFRSRTQPTPFSMDDRLRVVIADDHPIVRSGVRAIAETQDDMEIVGEASTIAEAETLVREHQPRVVVLDLQMPGGGLEAIRRMTEIVDDGKILVLTMHEDPANVLGAFKAGARGYLVKRASADAILNAIRVVASGKRFVDPTLGLEDVPEPGQHHSSTPPHALSRRERQVLELVARGYTNKEIAEQLHISVKSVETYRSRVLDKLELQSRAELVRYALEHGLLDSSTPPPPVKKT